MLVVVYLSVDLYTELGPELKAWRHHFYLAFLFGSVNQRLRDEIAFKVYGDVSRSFVMVG